MFFVLFYWYDLSVYQYNIIICVDFRKDTTKYKNVLFIRSITYKVKKIKVSKVVHFNEHPVV